eukprot:symbB.v1.2.036636.t1/scaffold5215.1/size29738/5
MLEQILDYLLYGGHRAVRCIVDRKLMNCPFAQKARRAQAAGAKLLIVVMNTSAVTMGVGESLRQPHLPALAISKASEKKAGVSQLEPVAKA